MSKLLSDNQFEKSHKSKPSAFTRNRKIPFKEVVKFLLRKSVKSLQLMLTEWEQHLGTSVTPSAFSQARQKLKYTAFIELLNKAVVEVMYEDDEYNKFMGHRLLAVDGSSLRLPDTKETRKEFGYVEHLNGNKTVIKGQVESKMTVLYDVLNEIPISAYMHRGRQNDLSACKAHLKDLKEEDILIADRAYGSYQFFAEIIEQKADFIIRCRDGIFDKYLNLLSDLKKEVIVEVSIPKYLAKLESLPQMLKLRFIRIPLSSGEIEILATSLVDTAKYQHSDFQELYFKRWKVETYFSILKSRLCVDNFTGKTLESIYQDFYATILISGLETILTEEAQNELKNKDTMNSLKVNKVVSFHAIKSEIVNLMFDPPIDFEERIKKLFLKNPTAIRPHRLKEARIKKNRGSDRRSLYFHRYAKKQVF